jgi:hypothetical protein
MVVMVSTGANDVTVRLDAATGLDEIHNQLLQLPCHTVFDFLGFKYERSTATAGSTISGRTRRSDGKSPVRLRTRTARGSAAWCVLVCVIVATLATVPCEAQAQGRDRLVDGAAIGAAVGAATGIAFTHAVRDSDLGLSQYAYGAVVFGALGAGVGVGLDALLDRASPGPRLTRRRMVIAPMVWRDLRGLAFRWKW